MILTVPETDETDRDREGNYCNFVSSSHDVLLTLIFRSETLLPILTHLRDRPIGSSSRIIPHLP